MLVMFLSSQVESGDSEELISIKFKTSHTIKCPAFQCSPPAVQLFFLRFKLKITLVCTFENLKSQAIVIKNTLIDVLSIVDHKTLNSICGINMSLSYYR